MTQLPINCAARNCVWPFPRIVRPRFPGAPVIREIVRSYEAPDFASLPGGGDVEVELYGGALRLRLDGEQHRVYIARFVYVRVDSYHEALRALGQLWQRVRLLSDVGEIEVAFAAWWESRPPALRSPATPTRVIGDAPERTWNQRSRW